MASNPPSRSRRRWLLRYSLRTFLLGMTVVCLFLGMYVKQVLDQKTATETVQSWGSTVLLDYQWQAQTTAAGNSAARTQPQLPHFQKLRNILGNDYFSDVVAVSIPYHVNAEIDVCVLYAFKRLRVLTLSGTHANDDDLRKLLRLNKIEILHLADTDVTDNGTQWLIQMPRLKNLSLRGTVLSDAGLAALSKKHSLEDLDVSNSNITEEGLARLKKALPNCKINGGQPATRKPLKW